MKYRYCDAAPHLRKSSVFLTGIEEMEGERKEEIKQMASQDGVADTEVRAWN